MCAPTPLPDHPFTATTARARGWSPARLRSAVIQGEVRRVLHGAYVRADVPDDPPLRAAAAALVLPPRMVVCDRSAAWLHGVDAFDPQALDVPPRLEMVAPDGTRPRTQGVRGGRRTLVPDDIVLLDGVQVTSPLRTAADLARQRGRLGAIAVLDAFARHHELTRADYARITLRLAGLRGVTQLRELGHQAHSLAESPGESWTRQLIVDHQLPLPTSQFTVRLEGATYRLDLAYPHLRVAVEYDGEEFHTDPAHVEHDRARRAALRRAGWIVIVVTKNDVSGNALDRWIAELRSAVRERAPQGPARYARGERTSSYPRRRAR
ncbi:hypothetical protein [Nocardioides acrostichi]|uniref:DUF559 domain-containing protein n=1 Tax=Nocardioides acrostichi TaxID=2784339 RepID=A0A930V109_9ACTN|nr:hypothetical protein [Nocardioides acrostichi]MBF4161747.1 hypothetical protein [Nocardioides acrostichi]